MRRTTYNVTLVYRYIYISKIVGLSLNVWVYTRALKCSVWTKFFFIHYSWVLFTLAHLPKKYIGSTLNSTQKFTAINLGQRTYSGRYFMYSLTHMHGAIGAAWFAGAHRTYTHHTALSCCCTMCGAMTKLEHKREIWWKQPERCCNNGAVAWKADMLYRFFFRYVLTLPFSVVLWCIIVNNDNEIDNKRISFSVCL